MHEDFNAIVTKSNYDFLITAIKNRYDDSLHRSIVEEVLVSVCTIDSYYNWLGINITGCPTSAPNFCELEQEFLEWAKKLEALASDASIQPFYKNMNGLKIVVGVSLQKSCPDKFIRSYGSLYKRLSL